MNIETIKIDKCNNDDYPPKMKFNLKLILNKEGTHSEICDCDWENNSLYQKLSLGVISCITITKNELNTNHLSQFYQNKDLSKIIQDDSIYVLIENTEDLFKNILSLMGLKNKDKALIFNLILKQLPMILAEDYNLLTNYVILPVPEEEIDSDIIANILSNTDISEFKETELAGLNYKYIIHYNSFIKTSSSLHLDEDTIVIELITPET